MTETVRFPSDDDIDEHVPEDVERVSVTYDGDEEVVEYRTEDKGEHVCGECGDTFDTHQALAGHQNTHN